jgi:hypothetical protein
MEFGPKDRDGDADEKHTDRQPCLQGCEKRVSTNFDAISSARP